MIFAWGTGYKLSLYKSEPGACAAPAKVCTRGSDAAKIAVEYAADGHAANTTFVAFATVFLLDSPAKNYPANVRREEAVDLSPLSRAPILYLRPPPHEELLLD